MQFQNSFDVPLPPADAWRTLLDIQKVAPCVPGAELTEVIDDKTYKGRVSVRLGPVALVFAGVVVFEEIDEAKFSARVSARGADAKGRGNADAKVQFALEPIAEGTRVVVDTNLNLTGSVAQYGRAGSVIRGVANQLTTEFSENLKNRITSERSALVQSMPEVSAASPPEQQTARPISGFGLMLKLLRSWLRGLFSSNPNPTENS